MDIYTCYFLLNFLVLCAVIYSCLFSSAAVFMDYGKQSSRAIRSASPVDLRKLPTGIFPAGSMGPKIDAACQFVEKQPHGFASIGALKDLREIIAQSVGTRIAGTSAFSYY